MPYDTVPGSTDPTTLDGGVYSPIPNDPAVLIESFVEANVAASAASAAAAAASAAAALASQGAANTSAIAAAASGSAAASSASSASASASTASTAATSAAGSASAAATSATNAAASTTAASNSASAAATSATNASNSASAASGSASAAAASAAAALTSENNAAASFLSFDQKYLGAKAANPTVNNQGGALAAGMLYFNTGSNELRMYTGSAWVGVPGVLSFNTRTGAITLTSGDVTSALTYTPANKAGDTFTGNVGVGVAPVVRMDVATTGGSRIRWDTSTATEVTNKVSNAADSAFLPLFTDALNFRWRRSGSGSDAVFFDGNGLGIGVTPTYRVDALGGNGNGYRYTGAASQVFFGEAGSIGAVGTLTNHALSFLVNNSAIARFTTQGNFGVGTTPSASWRAGAAAIQAGVFTTLHTASNGGATLAFGAYESGTNSYSYSTTGDLPTVYQQLTGAHIWSAAVAGSAGNPISFTELARLSSTGFGIGVSPAYLLDVKSPANGATTPTARMGGTRSFFFQPETGSTDIYGPVLGFGAYANTATGNYIQPASIGMTGGALIAGPYAGGLAFYTYDAGVEAGTTQTLASTKRMTLDASGNLGIGVAPSHDLDISKSGQTISAALRAAAGQTAILHLAGNNTSPGSTSFDLQMDSAGNANIVQRNNARLSMYTNGSERFQLTAGGITQLFSPNDKDVLRVVFQGGPTGSNGGAINFQNWNNSSAAVTLSRIYCQTTSGAVGNEAGDLIFYTKPAGGGLTQVLRLTDAQTILDGSNIELGFKGVPDASVTTGAFAATDRGKRVKATAGVTIPNSTMANGDVVHVLNTTGAGITITKSITTAYNKNTGSALGATFTLAARGSMTIEFTSGTECYIGGNIS